MPRAPSAAQGPARDAGGRDEEMTLAWTSHIGTQRCGGSWTVLLLRRGRCLDGFVPKTQVSSQVYEVLPEFDYPGSIRDPPLCPKSFWDTDIPIIPPVPGERELFYIGRRYHFPSHFGRTSQMNTYKLFQVKVLPNCICWFLFMQEPRNHSNVL